MKKVRVLPNQTYGAGPFLKWAGGKRRIMPLIEPYFPKKFKTYYEPFLGGGSVFFHVKQKYNPALCVISDTNKDLINTYVHVRDEVDTLIKYLEKFKKKNSKEFYYIVRKKFNQKKYVGIERSAAFIYLNKTCFNGLYRVNSKNEFNVPYGRFANTPGIYDEQVLRSVSALLKDNVEIKHQDYAEVLRQAKKGDFVYLDPCYDPIKKTSFVNYTPERFSDSDRNKLFSFIETLRNRGTNVVLSNNDVGIVKRMYIKSNYRINTITAPRFVGSRTAYRADVNELVITTRF